jgi:hypothetical protein
VRAVEADGVENFVGRLGSQVEHAEVLHR